MSPADSANPRSDKDALRRRARQRRSARDPDAARLADGARTQRLMGHLSRFTPRSQSLGPGRLVVAAYWSNPGEPGTHGLIAELAKTGHRVLLPMVSTGRENPSWGWFTEAEALVAAPMGLAEPDRPAESGALGKADVVLCPGLLGGRDGSRLGTGGGWYDRAMVDLEPTTPRWLLLFADEVEQALPTESHDLRVSDLVTESSWVHCSPA